MNFSNISYYNQNPQEMIEYTCKEYLNKIELRFLILPITITTLLIIKRFIIPNKKKYTHINRIIETTIFTLSLTMILLWIVSY